MTSTTTDLNETLREMSDSMRIYRELQPPGYPLINPDAVGPMQVVRQLGPSVGHAMEAAGVLAVVVPGLVVVNNPPTKQICTESISNETQRRLGLPEIGFHRGLN